MLRNFSLQKGMYVFVEGSLIEFSIMENELLEQSRIPLEIVAYHILCNNNRECILVEHEAGDYRQVYTYREENGWRGSILALQGTSQDVNPFRRCDSWNINEPNQIAICDNQSNRVQIYEYV